MGREGIRETSVPSVQLFCEPKTTLKNKVYEKATTEPENADLLRDQQQLLGKLVVLKPLPECTNLTHGPIESTFTL